MSRHHASLLSVVVIGLNEEDRLQASLEAIFAFIPKGFELEVFYVDSGSTDRSVEIAKSIPGVQLLHIGSGRPSAAKARNVGLRRVNGEFVQLIDGDSVLQEGWLEKALDVLTLQPEVSCVFGRCIEMHPEQSVYMKVCGLDWHGPAGDRRYCGGNAMWRTSVLASNGFFDEDIRVGEEPELCYRVRHQGGRILCIDAPMVKHDLGMKRFAQYWRRAVNSGQGYASIALRYWRTSEKLWLRELLINFAEPLTWMAALVAGWTIFGLTGAVATLVAWWVLRALQIAYTVRGQRLGWPRGLLYGLHCQIVRLPTSVGQWKGLVRALKPSTTHAR